MLRRRPESAQRSARLDGGRPVRLADDRPRRPHHARDPADALRRDAVVGGARRRTRRATGGRLPRRHARRRVGGVPRSPRGGGGCIGSVQRRCRERGPALRRGHERPGGSHRPRLCGVGAPGPGRRPRGRRHRDDLAHRDGRGAHRPGAPVTVLLPDRLRRPARRGRGGGVRDRRTRGRPGGDRLRRRGYLGGRHRVPDRVRRGRRHRVGLGFARRPGGLTRPRDASAR